MQHVPLHRREKKQQESEMDDVCESILGKTYDLLLPARLTPAPLQKTISQSDSEPSASPAHAKHICT